MIATRIAILFSAALALSACQTTPGRTVGLGQAELRFAEGGMAGTAKLLPTGDKVTVAIGLAGFTPGTHAVHLHTTGSCEAPDFTSAGGHLNPETKEHGMNNPNGAHLGDLRNVEIAADGTGTLTALLPGSRSDVLAAIYDTDGTAVVVHAGPDDYRTDPAGNAGGRIACGVFSAG